MSARGVGRLLRLSLAPSAIADIAAGVVLGAGRWPGGARPFVLMLASACVYHGGMALNDWADREADRRGARGRPIQTGEVASGTALLLALALLLTGPLLALRVDPGAAVALAVVAVLALWYDLAGRGPWRGPLLLGGCRAGNLGAGLIAGGALAGSWSPGVPILAAGLYGLYVAAVSRLARLEDSEDGTLAQASPRRGAILAACLLFLVGCPALFLRALPALLREAPLPVSPADLVAILGAPLLAALGAAGLVHAARAPGPWTHARIGAWVGMGLRRLLVATAALALQAGAPGLWVAPAILLGYGVSFLLRRVFPPT